MNDSMEYKYDHCTGCVVQPECGIPYHNLEEEVNQCPCGICLVKMMCDNSTCKRYSKFMRKVIRP